MAPWDSDNDDPLLSRLLKCKDKQNGLKCYGKQNYQKVLFYPNITTSTCEYQTEYLFQSGFES